MNFLLVNFDSAATNRDFAAPNSILIPKSLLELLTISLAFFVKFVLENIFNISLFFKVDFCFVVNSFLFKIHKIQNNNKLFINTHSKMQIFQTPTDYAHHHPKTKTAQSAVLFL